MQTIAVYIDDRAMQALEDVARVTGRSTTDLASAAVEEAAMAARRGGDSIGPRQGHLPLTSMRSYTRMDSDYPSEVPTRDDCYPIADPRRHRYP